MALILSSLAVVAIFILLRRQSSLGSELRELRQRLAALEARPTPDAESAADAADETPAESTPEAPEPEAPEPVDDPTPPPSAESVLAARSARARPRTERPRPPRRPEPPPHFVFTAARWGEFAGWLQANWFLAVAAVSLALAGVFFVQYGVEHGILPPPLRVASSIALGLCLIGGGEWIRRRGGDEAGALSAYLPSTFAGAGLVAIFAGVVAARQLYGLIGPETTFASLVAVAGLGVLIGRIYGPFTTAIGLTGAAAAPFLASGESSAPGWLFYYFALVAGIGLAVDAGKRTAWVSALAMALAYLGAAAVYVGTSDNGEHLLAFAVILAVLAVFLPQMTVRPAHEGAMTFFQVHGLGPSGWPDFPARLAAGAVYGLATVAFLVAHDDATVFWLAIAALTLAFAGLALGLKASPALEDLAAPLLTGLVVTAGAHGFIGAPAAADFRQPLAEWTDGPPLAVTALVAVGLLSTIVAALKSFRATDHPLPWAGAAALAAPAMIVALHLYWAPATHLTDVAWALHVVAAGAALTFLADRAYRVDGADRRRTAIFALAALTVLSFALSIVFTKTALTLAVAVMVVTAAILDRRFDIKPLTWFVQGGAAACGYRLIVDPGVPWMIDAPLWDMSLAFLGVVGLFAAGWFAARRRRRTSGVIVLESGAFAFAAVYLTLLLYRYFSDFGDMHAYWRISLVATIWLLSSATQFYRVKAGGPFMRARAALGDGFGAIGLLCLGVAGMTNPLIMGVVSGGPIFDSLLVAYGVPALLLSFVAWRFTHLNRLLRIGVGAIAGMAAALYVGLEIRRLWQGPVLSLPGVADGEQYSYTITLLLLGSGLLVAALRSRRSTLRKVALAVIGLAIAKVFLIDMSGLTGLIRVFSFLALGLSLVALAWLNRWMTERYPPAAPDEPEGAS